MGKVVELDTGGPEVGARDALTEILRTGARKLLATALEVEVTEFLEEYRGEKDDEGRQRVVRNGYLPEREVQTGIGSVPVRVPRTRDRKGGPEAVRFQSSILPPYLRRSKSIEDLLPWLYLKGVSTGDFSDALTSLLGPDAPGLSASSISRLKGGWEEEYRAWQRRDLSGKRYVYVWADGVYLQSRLESEKQCVLVLMGSAPPEPASGGRSPARLTVQDRTRRWGRPGRASRARAPRRRRSTRSRRGPGSRPAW